MLDLPIYAASVNPYSQLSGISVYVTLIVIAAVLTFRLYRSLKGTKFSTFALIRLPAMYTVLMIFSFAAYLGDPYIIEIIIASVAVLAGGVLAGRRYASGAEFFEKEGHTHYKRAPYILIVWMAAFIARFALEIELPTLFPVTLAVTLILAFSTGLIIGEALHIHEKYKIHKSKN